jgi:hypothetical protein
MSSGGYVEASLPASRELIVRFRSRLVTSLAEKLGLCCIT